jgi:hypothetical protein
MEFQWMAAIRDWCIFVGALTMMLLMLWLILETRRSRLVLGNNLDRVRKGVSHMEHNLMQTQPMFQCENFSRVPARQRAPIL